MRSAKAEFCLFFVCLFFFVKCCLVSFDEVKGVGLDRQTDSSYCSFGIIYMLRFDKIWRNCITCVIDLYVVFSW